MSANGTELTIAGKGFFSLEIGEEQFQIEALVADLSIDGILGLDFMKQHQCSIDLHQDVLKFQNSSVKLQFAGKMGCYRVSAAKVITITYIQRQCFLG